MTNKKGVALVLGGGTARGLAHIGVLEVLEENHVKIDAIVGTSMGALIGGLYASGDLNKFKEKMIKLSKNKISLFFMTKKLKSMKNISDSAMDDFLKDIMKDKKIEKLPIDYTAIATDIDSGEEVYLKEGSLLKAISASTCIPGVFKPVFLNNRYLVDGGVVDPLPQKYASEIATKIIIVNAMPKEYKYARESNDVFEVLSKATSIMANTLLNLKNIINIQANKDDYVFIQLETDKIGPFDFSDVQGLIDLGRKEAKKMLPKILELVKE
ncbi:MAG: patatin-like phospholipase family protein [Candidatus Pacearchaeota archaeon]|jgi:NTE family protein